ncbi:MAG: tyrosine-type recombinase/integrase [Oscillospiraceae bacterium]|nr:tyrosine-type recombinase/integrase [Oscillospiraceae bacterium]
MCCLFGFVDYGHKLSRKQRHRLLTILSASCEERGTDATGISYNFEGKQYIYKRPLPAHLMWYRVPLGVTAVMGHTRMTTQGSALKNENNHPFSGHAGSTRFALAHNGIIYNDQRLRKKMNLPATKIETDSYVAVQLIERFDAVDFYGLQFMAEQLEGSFTITALTEKDELYIVKGNNPMCIYHYPEAGIFVYASTEDILKRAMLKALLPLGKAEKVYMVSGEILRIDAKGRLSRSHFDDSNLFAGFSQDWGRWASYDPVRRPLNLYHHPVNARLIPFFGNAPIEDILPIHVQDYVNQMTKKYKPETIKKDITVLSFIMQNAVDNGLCRKNPVTKSVRLPKVERAEKSAYTQEQYDIVYEFAKQHPNGLDIMVLMETGLSRSEFLGLTWKDFDAKEGIFYVNQGLVSYHDVDEGWVTEADGLKNEYRRRAVPIVEPELLKRLREKPKQITLHPNRYKPEITEIVDTTFIFHSPSGKAYQPNNWNNRVFLPFMCDLQKAHPEIPKLSAHELRHTRASLWTTTLGPYTTARLLGHSDLKMLLKIYDHTNIDTLKKAMTGTAQSKQDLL